MADNNANPFDLRGVSYTEARSCKMRFAPYRKLRTVSDHPTGQCNVCFEEGCGLKMKCLHYTCPDDILNYAWLQVETMKYEITCADANCSKSIPTEDIIKYGLPTLEEEQFLTTAITTNFYESQDIQECPKCHTLCSRQRTDSPQVHCSICPQKGGDYFMFCWYCLREWKNKGNHQVCGNANCMKESIETLMKSPMKNFTDHNGKTISIPKWGACPNKSCSTLIEHEDFCNQMTCKCKTKFCFICLSKASDGSLACKSRSYNATGIKCVPAPIQTKL